MNPSASIEDLPPLRDIIDAHDLRAKKSLGQNFLCDLNLTDKIVRHVPGIQTSHVIEIGPGPGGLTRSLLRPGPLSVTAVEFDPRAIAALQSLKEASAGRLILFEGDALQTDISALCPAPRQIVANLPYNISTPLLLGWLRQIRDEPSTYTAMTLMFQKEVAQRLCAQPRNKAYGRLSVITQWLCNARILFDIPPSAFVPAPKVTSSVVQITPKALSADAPDFETVESITAAAFGQRRKMIRTSLKAYAPQIKTSGLDETLRAEALSVSDFLAIARHSS